MTIPQIFLILVVIIPLVLVSLDRLRIDVAALLMAVTLGLAQFMGMGILGDAHTPNDAIKAISGLSQPVVLTLLSLFIITYSLSKSGVTRWVAKMLLKIGGHSERRLIALFSTTTAFLSLFMNNLAAGALILPSAMQIARRTGIKPSKLLIPVAYGSLLGGAATYFATANIIVSDLLVAANPSQPPLNILDFTPTGGLLAIAGIIFLAFFGRRWLPDREPSPEQMIARLTSSDLEKYYQLDERLWELRVLPESKVINKPLSESEIGKTYGLAVAGIKRRGQPIFAPLPEEIIKKNDVLLIIGREERVNELSNVGLSVVQERTQIHISKYSESFIEVMPSPHSHALGKTLRELEFREKYQLTALALFRGGRSYRTDVGNFSLTLGDSLIMIGSDSNLKRLQSDPDFIVLTPDLSDQPIQSFHAILTIIILVGAITASILGFPVYLAMLIGAVLLMLTKALDMEEAYRSINWESIMLIAGMYSVSLAMVNTGLAQLVGGHFLSLITPFGPLGLACGAYLLTAALTQLMGGQVSALVTGPITISAAISMGMDPQAVAVATAIGCSASFFTPIAHPVNILMIAPGNYKFRDFLRIGWRMTIVSFLALIIGLKLFWGL